LVGALELDFFAVQRADRWNCSPIGALRGQYFSISAGEWRRYEVSGGGSEMNLHGHGGADTLEEADAVAMRRCRSNSELTNCRILLMKLRKCS